MSMDGGQAFGALPAETFRAFLGQLLFHGGFEPHYNRIENYHHPRHLMLNLQMLERLGTSPAAGSEPH